MGTEALFLHLMYRIWIPCTGETVTG